MSITRLVPIFVAATLFAAPALAGSVNAASPGRSSIPIPEPTDFALFAAGVVGLFIGRRSSRNRKRD